MKIENEIQCCVTHCDNPIDQKYWNERWEKSETGWDVGYASPAITEYLKQYSNKNAAILIPGCGNAYEAAFLVENGFTDITLIDIAPKAVEMLKKNFTNNPQVKIICEDFFLHEGKYDLIVEQTFFCAIPP
ncbi:MAG: methyltransferase domain-containing protein, partial [Bacteroidota bacterium]